MKTSTLTLLALAGVGIYLYTRKPETSSDNAVPLNPYGVTANKTTKENLDAANTYRANQQTEATNIVNSLISKASATNRSQQVTTKSGVEITAGPSGNTYFTDTATGKGVFSIGASSSTPKASTIVSASDKNLAARQAANKAKLASVVKPVGTYPSGRK